MTEAEKLARYEEMRAEVLGTLSQTQAQMDALKAAGRVKSATYLQLRGNKLLLQEIAAMYKRHGIED